MAQPREKANVDLLGLQDEFFTMLKGKGRSVNTLKNYRTDLDCFNKYLVEVAKNKRLDISGFSIPEIKEYGSFLEKKYNSDNSRRRRVQALRMFFDFLVEEKVFPSNPVRKIPTSPKFLDIPRPTPYVDVKTLWQFLLEESVSKQPMVRLIAKRNMVTLVLIYGAGLKVSDLSDLQVSQVYLDGDSPRVLINPPKRDPYTVPLPKIFTTIFNDYSKTLATMKKDSKVEFDSVLFNANPYRILSGGLSSRGIEIIFEEFRKKLMIECTAKSLRQACIFKWLKQKHKDSQIKEWLGLAPSYNLKMYKEHLSNHAHDEGFLEEIHSHFVRKGLHRR
ncbi:MAG: hypothetical protein CME70_16835 [Halobacteriovorax sp.]|nr:hypothetical protein [Halobacteriovorax sp.]